MESRSLKSANKFKPIDQGIQEIRVTADQLASTFPDSTKFDRTPSAIFRLQQSKTSAYDEKEFETNFFPENLPTLEPISTNQIDRNNLEQEDSLRRDKIGHLAKMKLRVEAPFLLQNKMELQIDDLSRLLINRDEYIKSIEQSYRNLQRAYNQKAQEYNTKSFYLKKKCNSKNKTIAVIATAAILLITINTISFFSLKKSTDQFNISTTNSDIKDVDYKNTTKPRYIYTVKENDTLSVISKKIYNDAKYYKLIMETNKLDSNQIKVGQKLLISDLTPEE